MKKIVIMIFVFICVYCVYVSYYHIDVTQYEMKSHKIIDDVNIVMIGDVHDEHCLVKEEVVNHINELNPDIILCVGDMIDDQSINDEKTLSFLSELVQISDVYMSLGNHEISFYKGHMEDLKRIEDIGVYLLEEDYQDIEINGNMIRLGGMYDYAFGMNKGEITEEDMNNHATYQFLNDYTNTSLFKLMMAHRPDSFIFGEATQWDIDLVVSAHVHGGQVILPFIGGLYAPEQGWFPQYDYGQFYENNTTLLITRGVSSSREYFPRFNNPCEIIQLKLTKK